MLDKIVSALICRLELFMAKISLEITKINREIKKTSGDEKENTRVIGFVSDYSDDEGDEDYED